MIYTQVTKMILERLLKLQTHETVLDQFPALKSDLLAEADGRIRLATIAYRAGKMSLGEFAQIQRSNLGPWKRLVQSMPKQLKISNN